jgi:hypothetical protein
MSSSNARWGAALYTRSIQLIIQRHAGHEIAQQGSRTCLQLQSGTCCPGLWTLQLQHNGPCRFHRMVCPIFLGGFEVGQSLGGALCAAATQSSASAAGLAACHPTDADRPVQGEEMQPWA